MSKWIHSKFKAIEGCFKTVAIVFEETSSNSLIYQKEMVKRQKFSS
jgi:hypothetical protein